jgi:diguanylate cyclase (GGDEF)-like protein
MASVSVRYRVLAGFGILVGILAVVTIGAAIQVRNHQSDLARVEEHSTMSSLLQTAEAQAAISAELLQRYVYTGDGQYISELNDHAAAAQTALNAALARGGPGELTEIVIAGTQLEQGAARASTLRQAGDEAAASAEVERLAPVFRDYRIRLEALSAGELDQVVELRAQANAAGRLAFWLLVASGTIGVVVGLTVSFWIARSIIRPLASLERTARKVSAGDLSARAPVTGPRELTHLGAVLNEMMSAIEERAEDLRQANRRLRAQNRELTDARIQAATDPLTGLGNHRAFHKSLRDEAEYAIEHGGSLGLVIIDLDGFKEVNDSLGHLAGDQLLREVAAALGRVVNRDKIYRYGGDELAVLLPGESQAATLSIAEQLQGAILGVSSAPGHGVTASFGVACLPDSASTSEEAVYRADMAMYWAKSAGKNRVSAWSDVAGATGDPQYGSDRRRPSDVVTSLRMALAAKDDSSRDRAERCAMYAGELARALGLSDADAAGVRLAALTHDVGILATPDEILSKPGPLTAKEMAQVKRHPVDGANMLSHTSAAGMAAAAVLYHHERFDGSGYPNGLAGEMIPVAARIVTVADAYVAMTSDRPYRVAMTRDDALAELERGRGTQFDPRIVDAFLHLRRSDVPDGASAPAAGASAASRRR